MVLVVVALLVMASATSADIYRYVDEEGVICYTDAPRGKKAEKIYRGTTQTLPPSAAVSERGPTDGHALPEYHEIVHEKASQYDLDPTLIKAVIATESNWNSRAVSRKGAMGLMQLMPATAVDMNVRDPYDPAENIEGGTKYLRYLLERFNGDLTLALAAYNAGPKTVEKFGYVPPISETKNYVNKVLALYRGQTSFSSSPSEPSYKKRYQPIYKVLLDDGSLLFTNSSLLARNTVRF